MQYIIYKLQNKLNGKVYIGKTKRGLNRRLKEHISNRNSCRYLKNAIQKYGFDTFEFVILGQAKDEQELCNLEREFILKFNSISPNGYNLVLETDQGRMFHPETLKKISKNVQGTIRTRKTWSSYIGVRTRKNINVYSTRITKNGKTYIRYYNTEIEAAEAYDKVALFLYGWRAKLNFIEKIPKYRECDLKKFFCDFKKKQTLTSQYKGISYAPYLKMNKWRAVIYENGKQINVGVYKTEKEAYEAREKYKIDRDVK